LDKIIPPVI